MKEKEIKEEEKGSDSLFWVLMLMELLKPNNKNTDIEILENRIAFLEGKISTIENLIK